MDDQLGIDELVDTCADLLETADIIIDAAADGIGFDDIGAVLSIAPKVNELRRDYKAAVNELLDLTPEESAEAARRIAARTGKLENGIINRVNEAFVLVARIHRLYTDARNIYDDAARWGKSLKAQQAAA